MEQEKSAFIGVDIGGTNLRTALVDQSGKILRVSKTEVLIERGAAKASERLFGQCRSLVEIAKGLGIDVAAVGLGVAGRIDGAAGRVVFSPNLPALDGYPLGAELQSKLGIPVFMENDANVFGLGEGWTGAAKGIENWVGITMGTGTGGCLFLGGRIWAGDGLGFSAEAGHMIVLPDGPICPCGSKGCLEAFASARALVSGAKRIAEEKGPEAGPLFQLMREGTLNAETIHACASTGDPAARGLFEKMGWALGTALANIFTLLGIRHAVIGGNVSDAWDLFIGPLKTTLTRNLSMLEPDRAVVLRRAQGDDAALIGAARHALACSKKLRA